VNFLSEADQGGSKLNVSLGYLQHRPHLQLSPVYSHLMMAHTSRVPISHPYPPVYQPRDGAGPAPYSRYTEAPSRGYEYQRRDDGPATSPNTAQTSQAYAPDGQRRRDDWQQPAPASDTQPPSQSYAYHYQRRRDERHQPAPSYPTDPDPNPNPANQFTMARNRFTSETSLHQVLSGKGEDCPEGWSKEDEEAEREFMAKGLVSWGEMRSWRFWIRKEWWSKCIMSSSDWRLIRTGIVYYLILFAIGVLVVLMTVYHDQVSRLDVVKTAITRYCKRSSRRLILMYSADRKLAHTSRQLDEGVSTLSSGRSSLCRVVGGVLMHIIGCQVAGPFP